jgi:hypothetical protein
LNRLTFYIKQLENLVKTKPKNCGGAIEAKPMQHILRGPWWGGAHQSCPFLKDSLSLIGESVSLWLFACGHSLGWHNLYIRKS